MCVKLKAFPLNQGLFWADSKFSRISSGASPGMESHNSANAAGERVLMMHSGGHGGRSATGKSKEENEYLAKFL